MVVSMERNIVIMLLCLLLANCAFLSKPAKATMYVGDVCKMRTGASGKCTIIQKCKTIDDALKERRMSTDDLVHCSFVGSDEVVCCPDPESTPDDKPTTTTKSGLIFDSTKRTTLNNSSSSTVTPPGTDVKVGEERPAVTACRRLQQNLAPELTQHILDGIPADLGEFPHMVAIGFPQIGNDLNYTFDCGGTLVSDKFVLTAAHCLLDGRRQPKIVRLGKVAIHSMKSQDNTDAVDIGIRQIIAHPQYVSPQTYHDIALIELENTVTFTENIRPTCLHAELEDPPQNATLYVTGWGTVNTATRSVSGILLKAKLQISPIEQCNGSHVTYGLTRLNSRGVIAQQICAYDPEIRRDACQGDSGGPLQMVLDESLKSYSVVGIVASGFGCGTQTPGLYTRVAAYLDFIEQYVWPTR